MENIWTKDQQRAIGSFGKGVTVSAAAVSGKRAAHSRRTDKRTDSVFLNKGIILSDQRYGNYTFSAKEMQAIHKKFTKRSAGASANLSKITKIPPKVTFL